MVLCIGPEGSGKSLLLMKVQNPEYVDSTTTSVPTVGTNILNLRVDDKLYTIREVGGKFECLNFRQSQYLTFTYRRHSSNMAEIL